MNTRHDDADVELVELCVTAPDPAWAAELTTRLVGAGLAACGQLQQIESIYTWNDNLEHHPETRVALHTRATHIATITEIVTATHPYELAGIFALPLTSGPDNYRTWILETTRNPDPGDIAPTRP